MEEGEEIESIDGGNSLPTAMIQHIQSLLTSKEATQTLTLSKSWLRAGLTHPNLEFDESNFRSEHIFHHYVYRTMQRYRDSNLKIHSFTLRTGSLFYSRSRMRSWFYSNDDNDDDDNNPNNNNEFVSEIILEALKMAIHDCVFDQGLRRVYSHSLERIRLTLTSRMRPFTPEFDFPNIRKFKISCKTLPKIRVKPPSSEWECRISIHQGACVSRKKLLDPLRSLVTKLTSCKISLSLTSDSTRNFVRERIPKLRCARPLPQLCIEDLTIDFPSSFPPGHLRALLMICRPNVINLSSVDEDMFKIVCWRLKQGPCLPSKIEVEYFDEALRLWQPLKFALLKKKLHKWPPLARKLKIKIRFQLRWG